MTLVKAVIQANPIYKMSSFQLRRKDTDKMNSIALNLFWGFKENKAKIHLLGRKKIMNKVGQGGLGFRDFRLVNKALMAKQFWRVVQRPTSVAGQWIHHKYVKPNSNLELKRSSLQSVCWKGIACNAEFIKQRLRWQLGNGTKIDISSRFWPWQRNNPRGTATVAELFNDLKDAWDMTKLDNFYNQ